jgi:flagellar hook-associated protein 1 FlgK
LQVQAVGGNSGLSVLLGSTAVGLDGIGGRVFFSTTSTGAADLSVDATIAANPNAVAAGTPGGGPLDGSIALSLADQSTSTTGADASYNTFVVALGSDSQNAQRVATMQSATTQQIDNQRQSYSGVNIDEEMTSMVQFQHAYEAAARYMTTIDSILDTLVNHTGIV